MRAKIHVSCWFKEGVDWIDIESQLAEEWNRLHAPPRWERLNPIIFDATKQVDKYLRFKEFILEKAGSSLKKFHEYTLVKYSLEELAECQLLKFYPDDTDPPVLLEPIYRFTDQCSSCGFRGKPIQEAPLRLDKGLGRRDAGWTLPTEGIGASGIYEVLVSARFKRLIEENNITGVEFLPVYIGGQRTVEVFEPVVDEAGLKELKAYSTTIGSKRVRLSDKVFQLRFTQSIAPLAAPPTRFSPEGFCDVCHMYKSIVRCYTDEHGIEWPTTLYFPKDAWSGADVSCYTWPDWDCSKSIVVSQRFFRLVREFGIKGCSFEPVYLV